MFPDLRLVDLNGTWEDFCFLCPEENCFETFPLQLKLKRDPKCHKIVSLQASADATLALVAYKSEGTTSSSPIAMPCFSACSEIAVWKMIVLLQQIFISLHSRDQEDCQNFSFYILQLSYGFIQVVLDSSENLLTSLTFLLIERTLAWVQTRRSLFNIIRNNPSKWPMVWSIQITMDGYEL